MNLLKKDKSVGIGLKDMRQIKQICLQTGLFSLIIIWGFALLHPLTPYNSKLDKIPTSDLVSGNPKGKTPIDITNLPKNDSPFLHKGEILVKKEDKVDIVNILKESIPSIVALIIFLGSASVSYIQLKKQIKEQKDIAIKQTNASIHSGFRQDRMRVFSESLSELLVDTADVSLLLQQKMQNIKEKKKISTDIVEKIKTVSKKLIFHQAKIDLLFYDMGENAQKLNNCIELLIKEAMNVDNFDRKEFYRQCDEIKKLGKLILNDEWGKMIDFQ